MSFTANVISTNGWNARPPKGFAGETRPRYLVIHHTATPNPPNDVSKGTLSGAKTFARSVQSAHMNGFGWIDSGHNFLNTTGGYLLEGRHGSLAAIKKGFSVRSAHAGTNKGNESPGIENEGTFITYQMKAKQWDSLVELCASICASAKISPDDIKGHRDFSPTQCPGDWLYSQLPRLRDEVRERLDLPLLIRDGSTGPKVKEVQELLKARGFPPGPIDGIFGPATEAAVIAFQKFKDLTPDGIVGPKTLEALQDTPDEEEEEEKPAPPVKLLETYKFYRGLPHQEQAVEWLQGQLSAATLEEFSKRWRNQPSEPFLPLQEGATGSEVRQVQKRLDEEGFSPGPIDGIFGPRTKSAVITFQKSKGIFADGIVGEKTWTTLNLA